jgi:hypothetical protein
MFVFVLQAFLPLLVIWDIVLQLHNRQWTQEVQREDCFWIHPHVWNWAFHSWHPLSQHILSCTPLSTAVLCAAVFVWLTIYLVLYILSERGVLFHTCFQAYKRSNLMQNVTDVWLPSTYCSEIAFQFKSFGNEILWVWQATCIQAAIKAVIECLHLSIAV